MQASAARKSKPAGFMKRGQVAETVADGDAAKLLATIEAGMDKLGPKWDELSHNLRHFVARYLSAEKSHQAVLGVVSPDGGAGRTTVAIGLASGLADIYNKVSLVEMGNGSRTISEDLGLSVSSGLTQYLHDGASLEDVLFQTGKKNLWLLPTTSHAEDVRLEATSRARELVADLRESFDVTIIDLPPLLENEETAALIRYLDGVIMVVRAGKTTSEAFSEAIALCKGVPIRGVLVNDTKSSVPDWVTSLTSI